jgi:hypothetical protein
LVLVSVFGFGFGFGFGFWLWFWFLVLVLVTVCIGFGTGLVWFWFWFGSGLAWLSEMQGNFLRQTFAPESVVQHTSVIPSPAFRTHVAMQSFQCHHSKWIHL